MSDLTLTRTKLRPSALALRALTDDQLGRLAARGDENAVAAIYERHHPALYRYCRSICRDPDDARDALQNTFVNAIRAIGDRGDHVPLKPWLFRIAHNESVSQIRRRRPHEDLEDNPTPSGEDPEEDAETREELRQLVADLQELPERQRGALVMRELNGLGYEAIGSAFGVSAAAAKQSVYEARVALHERAEGREMDCETVRRSVSDGDRRVLRGRKVRAHLRACAGCRLFSEAIPARRAGLAALAPAPTAATSASLLDALIGGGSGGGGGGAGGALTGAGLAGKAASAGLAAKAIVVAAVAVTGGTAVGVASDRIPGGLGAMLGGQSAQSTRPLPAGAADAKAAPVAPGAAERRAGGPDGGRAEREREEAAEKEKAREGDEKDGGEGAAGSEDAAGGGEEGRTGRRGRRGSSGDGGSRSQPLRRVIEPVRDRVPVPQIDRPRVRDLPPPTLPEVKPPALPEVKPPALPVEPPKLPLP